MFRPILLFKQFGHIYRTKLHVSVFIKSNGSSKGLVSVLFRPAETKKSYSLGYVPHFRRLSRRENFRCPLSAATFLSTVSVFELKKTLYSFICFCHVSVDYGSLLLP